MAQDGMQKHGKFSYKFYIPIMTTTVEYFGYGANRTPEMIEAIIGRIPEGYPATFSGFELCIQTWDEIPESAKKILSPPWDKTSKTYVVRPTNTSSKFVKGTVWKLTRQERAIIDNWEVTGHWYKMYVMQFTKGDERTQIEIQVIDDPKIKKVINATLYKNFLNSKEQMLKVARRCRETFLKGFN